jgi:hypothetical protein
MHLHISNTIQQQIAVEFAGVFWLAAEIFILLLLRAGRRHVAAVPLPRVFSFTRSERRSFVALLIGAVTLFAFAPGRYFVSEPWPDRLMAASPMEIAEIYHAVTHPHLALWTAFVLGWVALEIVIVWNGIALYRRIRNMLHAA